MGGSQIINELQSRGLIAQVSGEGELEQHLDQPRTLYCGFDPTADSLHLGHLVPLLVLKRFQEAGHTPVALVGGATGLIGDPSFKDSERQLNTPDIVASWADKIRRQVSQFIDFDCGENAAIVANNLDWTGEMSVLEFLRDVGKHFSINNMISKESVKQRIDREGAGISFTEFSYSLLQGLDFAELNRRYQCTLQVGGSDQWGNIVSGIDLSRRQNQSQVYGLTVPLITKADGTKFGKTESGAVWLDPAKTSPYMFYQFWINTGDADVYKFLRYFTFVSTDHIAAWEESEEHHQKVLADEVTRLVHGEDGLLAAQRITASLFGNSAGAMLESDFEQLKLDGLPTTRLTEESLAKPLTALLSEDRMGTGKQIKDALQRRAVTVNSSPIGIDQNMNAKSLFVAENARYGRFFLVRVGKKKYHLFERV